MAQLSEISPGLQRRPWWMVLLGGAGSLSPVYSWWPWWKVRLLGSPMKNNILYCLTWHNISIPACPLPPALLFSSLLSARTIGVFLFYSTLAITFPGLYSILAAGLPHPLGTLYKNVSQINESCWWKPPWLRILKIQTQGTSWLLPAAAS